MRLRKAVQALGAIRESEAVDALRRAIQGKVRPSGQPDEQSQPGQRGTGGMGGGDAGAAMAQAGQAAGEVRQARQARGLAQPSPSASGQAAQGGRRPTRRQAVGRWGEDQALACLQAQGLRLVQRNFRAPGRGGGEIDLVMQAGDGTLVFVEVRVRRASDYGGAGASIDARKRARIVLAAQHFLARWPGPAPACRFDVVLIDGQGQPPAWVQGAFDGGEGGHGAW